MEIFIANVAAQDVEKMKESFPNLSSEDKESLANSDTGKMAVFLASEDEDLLKKLLDAKFSASYTDDAGETALHRAVKANKPECVLLLLNCDSCDPNAADGHQQTALHRAGEFGSQACLEMLVNHERVNIDAEDAWSRTALHWTLQKAMTEQTQALLRREAQMITTVSKETPLHWAVRGGNRDQVEMLLQRHPELSVYALNDRMESPMDMARTLGFGTIVQSLWEHAQAHNQVPPTLNTVNNEQHVHDSGVQTMHMKPKGGVRKLTVKRLGQHE